MSEKLFSKIHTLAALLVFAVATSATSAEPRDGDVESNMGNETIRPHRFAVRPNTTNESADADVESDGPIQRQTIRRQPEPVAAPTILHEYRPEPVRPQPAVVHVTDSNFDLELRGYSGIVLIDFYSKMCGPCMKTSPIVERWADEFRGEVKVVKIDCDKAPKLVERFGVTNLPCLVLLNNGREVNRTTGEPRPDLLRRWVLAQR